VVSGRHTGSQGTTFLKLKPWGERKRTQLEIIIISALALEMTAIPGVVAFPSNPPPLSGKAPASSIVKVADIERCNPEDLCRI